MESRKVELLDEISQLYEQYRQEVPGRRRAWPESIKSRVLELRKLGLNFTQISKRTNLPYFTVLKWHREKKAPSFEMVNVVARSTRLGKRATEVATVTESTSAVTLVLANGIRIEEVSLSFLLGLLPGLGVGGR